ncbi:transcriptional regulator, GntR family [Phenylobacterium zucineum HLK1]|uniref:Transcriptional regulator, GntR family n=1 Tax=Phenylobacterium zucineum (strain HLK1) TaxID=450851 RepID=B4RFZ6_PHEZH|nr:GntR family transcriptional regulator [Phenylobacterium zucineum]ACG78809.1 transcriptional regulator, GntR family [Phenylobacterium zucineum HLK1]
MPASGPEPFHRALAALRSWLQEGRFAPGAKLAAVELAEELRLSATPVREAMARLAGEGVLEERRGQGFYVAHLTRADIADLYRVHLACLLMALDPSREPVWIAPPEAETFASPVAATESLLGRVLALTGSAALCDVFQLGQTRLGPVRRLEPEIFPDLEAEAAALAAGAMTGGPPFIELVRSFHLRRLREVDRLGDLLDRRARTWRG